MCLFKVFYSTKVSIIYRSFFNLRRATQGYSACLTTSPIDNIICYFCTNQSVLPPEATFTFYDSSNTDLIAYFNGFFRINHEASLDHFLGFTYDEVLNSWPR